MASRIRENQAKLARLQRTVETIREEADQPFLTTEAKEIFASAVALIEIKTDWLEKQIAAETATEAVKA